MEYIFPDGCHYRIEVSSIERAWIFQELVKKFRKANTSWNRAICCIMGAGAPRPNPMVNNKILWGFYTKEELREFAKIGAGEGVEVIMTPFTRPTYQPEGWQERSPGIICGMSWLGAKGAREYLEDTICLSELGFRGFLVWRKGILDVINDISMNTLPEEMTKLLTSKIVNGVRDVVKTNPVFKISIFDGNANPCDVYLAKKIASNLHWTINPKGNLSIEMLRELRSLLKKQPIDLHSRLFRWHENGEDVDRINEAYEIVMATSPVYFKDEPGPGLEMYGPTFPKKTLWEYKLSAVEAARQIIDNINRGNEKYGTNFKISEWGPNDLQLPIIK